MRSVALTIPAALVAQVRDGLLEVQRVRRDSLAHADEGDDEDAAGGRKELVRDIEAIDALTAELDRAQTGAPVELTADPALLRGAAADALLGCAEEVETDVRTYLETGRGDGVRRRATELVALVELLDEVPASG